jgi:Mrp family chromosome partitioning ATPase/capsular polysaccharide biosynthesis protein
MSDPEKLVRLHDQELALETTENRTHEGSDLRAIIALFRRHAVLIGVVTLLTVVVTYVVTKQEASKYTSTATLLYSEPPNASSSFNPARILSTYVGIGSSSAVLRPVAARHGLTLTQLRNLLSINANPDADLMTVSAVTGSPTESAAISNGVSDALITYSTTGVNQQLQDEIAKLQHSLQSFTGRRNPSSQAEAAQLRLQIAQDKAELNAPSAPLSVLSPATIPSGPSSPHPTRDAGIALLAGLVLALLLAAGRDRLDRRMREIEDVEAVYHAPTLGVVPFTGGRKRTTRAVQVADFSTGSGPLADAYRTIRTNLTLMQMRDGGPSVIVVTSATAGEGKSAVTANLAQALSVTGRHVLAVSADLHNPGLHEYFPSGYKMNDLPSYTDEDPLHGKTLDDPTLNAYFATGYGSEDTAGETRLEPRRRRRSSGLGEKWTGPTRPRGLVPVLAGEVGLDKAVYDIPLTAQERERGGSLHLLADERTFFDPAALLSSDSMRQLLKEASQSYDAIILDTPPLLANADATLLAQSADTLVLVARLDHLTRNQARRAYRILTSMRLEPSGIIVTGEVEDGVYGYGYGSNRAFEYHGLAGIAPERQTSTGTGSS